MKACPACGLDLEDTYLFCPEDGSPLRRPDAPAEQPLAGRTEGAAVDEPRASTDGHVILYCPACAAEYPLTFSECPVHGVALTKHNAAAFVEPQASAAQYVSGPPLGERRAQVNQEAQSAASYPGATAGDHFEPIAADDEPLREPLLIADRIAERAPSYQRAQASGEGATPEPKSFRIAAIMITVGLAALSLGGLYTLYSNVGRKPASQAARSVNKSQASTPETEFIPTPQAALDYKEEPPAPPEPEAPASSDETRHDKEPARAVSAAPSIAGAQKAEESNPRAASNQPPAAPQVPAAVKRPPTATDLVLPRGTYGLIDARLIRMRGRQTPSGYRYDLTFNLQEQAGRVTQYDRLAVVTRSASGINHSEVMPFFHRLGAAGDLTFTVSVELKGRSEADWQGRIICTGIGTDNQGRPLRTSFGANVSP